MMRPRGIAGEVVQTDEPNWAPLEELIGYQLADWFMWMHEIELTDGGRVHAYKHIDTRRYFHLATDGRLFAYSSTGTYVPIERSEAIDEAFHNFGPRHVEMRIEEVGSGDRPEG